MAIPFHSSSMTENEIVSNNVRLSGRVPLRAVPKWFGASSRSEESVVVSKRSYDSRLVEGLPVLHSVSEHLETEVGIISKILPASQEKKRRKIK